MTAPTGATISEPAARAAHSPAPPGRRGRAGRPRPVPPLSPRAQLARATLAFVCIISEGLLLQLVIVSSMQQRASQQRAFEAFRGDLARGTAPVGPTDAKDRLLRPGSPVAYLEIPSIGVKQVVVEGTTSSNLFTGPGHRRDTPLPGQPGVSVILGRKAAYGSPFGDIRRLRPRSVIHVTTGQGQFDYRVIGARREGQPVPPALAANAGRLTLVTAGGRAYVPSGVLRVDAELLSPAVPGEPRLVDAASLPAAERIMGADTGMLWALTLWLQALVLIVLGATWAWHQWGRARTWVVFVPLLVFVGISVSGEVARLLPNLL